MARRSIDNRLDFLSPLEVVPGLGPRRVVALNEAGLSTLGDLLYHLPRRYIDRSVITPIAETANRLNQRCCIVGTVTRTRVERGRRSRFRIQVTDESGSIEALWFEGISYFRQSIRTGMKAFLAGVVSRYTGVQMVHPAFEPLSANADKPATPYVPVYPLTAGMREAGLAQKQLNKTIQWALKSCKHYPQMLPAQLERKKAFPPLADCLSNIHMPQTLQNLGQYRERLVYEELYQLALTLRWSKAAFAKPGRAAEPGDLLERLTGALPFKLTIDQLEAIAVLHRDAASPRRMHRLLQGDVGAGKTIVAFCACLPALNSKLQAAWLAPTEILARQTYALIREWLGPFSMHTELLTGATPPKEKRRIVAALHAGKINFIVGTHALLQESMRFYRLGAIVIDEQHKFGARQRLTMQEKDPAADFLLMSATPIPQTLAKTLYDDLDLVTIRSRPHGRSPVKTRIVPETKRPDMLAFIAEQTAAHDAQAFYIAPRIEQNDESDGVSDAATVYKELVSGPLSGIPVGIVHGRLPVGDRDRVMRSFAEGTLRVLIATTVVEVGIDVPGATIMVIDNPERFGLSQLHQLRGRIGRGTRESYCFLLAKSDMDQTAQQRLSHFCSTTDGFALAELDLRYRGPGETAGFRQSGWSDLKMADILRDADLFREIQDELDALLGP